jgi:hypothetical protein
MRIKQCSGAPTGKQLRGTWRVETDLERNYIKVIPYDDKAIVRDARLKRSLTDYCKAKGATEQRVTWFSWTEYRPQKDGWTWITSGFGAGDANDPRVLKRISVIQTLQDADGVPVCYTKLDSEDS